MSTDLERKFAALLTKGPPDKLRDQWEGNRAESAVCEKLVEIPRLDLVNFLVVEKTYATKAPAYRCIRYFPVGIDPDTADWAPSVDGTTYDPETAFAWLGDPKAFRGGIL
jgi:hypothetical protein